jgi:hypothetical protein
VETADGIVAMDTMATMGTMGTMGTMNGWYENLEPNLAFHRARRGHRDCSRDRSIPALD